MLFTSAIAHAPRKTNPRAHANGLLPFHLDLQEQQNLWVMKNELLQAGVKCL